MDVRPIPLSIIREALDKPEPHPLRDWIAAKTHRAAPVLCIRESTAAALIILITVVTVLAIGSL